MAKTSHFNLQPKSDEYEIRSELASGDSVALEIARVGTLAVPFPSKPPGAAMHTHFATFLQFKDGKIVSQHNVRLL